MRFGHGMDNVARERFERKTGVSCIAIECKTSLANSETTTKNKIGKSDRNNRSFPIIMNFLFSGHGRFAVDSFHNSMARNVHWH